MKLIYKGLLYTFIPTAWLLSAPGPLTAQQKIDPTVEVRKAFEGNLMEIHKSTLAPAFNDSLSSFNLNFNYTIFDKPYKDLYEFTPLPSAQIQHPVEALHPVFFASVSAGYPFRPDVRLYFQPRLKGHNTLVLHGSHRSFWGKLPLMTVNPEKMRTEADKNTKIAADNMVNRIGADYGHSWKGGELSAGVNFSNNYYTYYGINPAAPGFSSQLYANRGNRQFMKDNLSHTYNQFGVYFRIASAGAKDKKAKFNYLFDFSYLHTADKPELEKPLMENEFYPGFSVFKENLFNIRGEFGPTFGRYSRLMIGVNSETVTYSGPQEYHYGIIEAVPQYRFEKNRWQIRAGIKISGKFSNKDNTGKYHTVLFAKADISYEIIKNYLWAYGKVDGWNNIRSYSSLLEENKWIGPLTDMKAGSVPFFARAGLRGHILSKLSYNVYASYTVHKGLIQYINYYPEYAAAAVPEYRNINSIFDAVYSNHREFSAGGEILWKSNDFLGGVKIKYSSYTKGKKPSGYMYNPPAQEAPLGYAPLEGLIYGEYNWRQRIFLAADLYFRGAVPACIYNPFPADPGTALQDLSSGTVSRALGQGFSTGVKIRSFADLSLRIKYAVNNRFAVFIKGANLLNREIEYYPQYLEPGISFEGGILVKF